jgi:lipoprotein-releasing system ATP-binding protein
MVVLHAQQLTKSYAGQPPVFRALSLQLAAGESVAVVGPSGCGKSTLLNCLGGLDRPDSGTVSIKGQPLESLSEDALARCRAQHIGFVFQDHHLLPQLSAEENVLLPQLALSNSVLSMNQADARAWARHLLAEMGLSGKENSRPAQLSGGERQRVALARALMNKPALILADEPTGALDQLTAGVVADLLLTMNKQHNTALVVVTHSSALAARMQRTISFTDLISADVSAQGRTP